MNSHYKSGFFGISVLDQIDFICFSTILVYKSFIFELIGNEKNIQPIVTRYVASKINEWTSYSNNLHRVTECIVFDGSDECEELTYSNKSIVDIRRPNKFLFALVYQVYFSHFRSKYLPGKRGSLQCTYPHFRCCSFRVFGSSIQTCIIIASMSFKEVERRKSATQWSIWIKSTIVLKSQSKSMLHSRCLSYAVCSYFVRRTIMANLPQMQFFSDYVNVSSSILLSVDYFPIEAKWSAELQPIVWCSSNDYYHSSWNCFKHWKW